MALVRIWFNVVGWRDSWLWRERLEFNVDMKSELISVVVSISFRESMIQLNNSKLSKAKHFTCRSLNDFFFSFFSHIIIANCKRELFEQMETSFATRNRIWKQKKKFKEEKICETTEWRRQSVWVDALKRTRDEWKTAIDFRR